VPFRFLLRRLGWLFPFRAGSVVLLLVALGLVTVFGPKEADFLLYPAGLVAIGLVFGSALLVMAGTLSMRRTVRRLAALVPTELETTRATQTGFRLPALRRWLVLDVSVSWVEPSNVSVALEALDGLLCEVVTAVRRGRYARVVRRFTVEDVFGLARLRFEVEWNVGLRIVPLAAVQSASLAAGRAQGETLANPAGRLEGDLVEMRAYAHGDSLRHVLWKAYARTGKLLVRMPERALAPGPVSIAFFVAGPSDEASAGAARLYVEAGLLGADLLFCADGATAPARTARDAVEQLVDSGAHRARGGESLDALALQLDPARLTSALFFVPALDGPWRDRVVGFVKRRGLDATVIIGVDDAPHAELPSSRLQAFLFSSEVGLEHGRPQLAQVRAALEREGLPVKVLHRGTGLLS
jgi:Protein of unknown function DUF58